jgi:hypothetical protein
MESKHDLGASTERSIGVEIGWHHVWQRFSLQSLVVKSKIVSSFFLRIPLSILQSFESRDFLWILG